jgi:hypothetical protein
MLIAGTLLAAQTTYMLSRILLYCIPTGIITCRCIGNGLSRDASSRLPLFPMMHHT